MMTQYVLQHESARIEFWVGGVCRKIPAHSDWLDETTNLLQSFAYAWCLCDTTAVSVRRPIESWVN